MQGWDYDGLPTELRLSASKIFEHVDGVVDGCEREGDDKEDAR